LAGVHRPPGPGRGDRAPRRHDPGDGVLHLGPELGKATRAGPGLFFPRAVVILPHLLLIPVKAFCTSGRSSGTRHERDRGWFFPALVVHSVITAWLLPYMDARDLGTLPGGDAVRWSGFALLVC